MLLQAFDLKDFISKSEKIRLSDEDIIEEFDCGNKDLNDFIINEALISQKLMYSVTYLLKYEYQIVAYFSLQNDKFRMSPNSVRAFKAALRKQTKTKRSMFYRYLNMEEFPALKITRFAVNKDFQRKGIGTFLLDAITYMSLNQYSAGCMFITVDAIKNAEAIDFYRKNKFQTLEILCNGKDSVLMYKNLIELI